MFYYFSEEQEDVIKEKLDQLTRIKEGKLTYKELSRLITERRLKWTKEHLEEMLKKYNGLPPEEQVYRIIVFDHMKVDPEYSEMIRLSPTKIRINSFNFCPYLVACEKLRLNTRDICKKVGEPGVQAMSKAIHPKVIFSRNYKNLRPFSSFCEEYFELIK